MIPPIFSLTSAGVADQTAILGASLPPEALFVAHYAHDLDALAGHPKMIENLAMLIKLDVILSAFEDTLPGGHFWYLDADVVVRDPACLTLDPERLPGVGEADMLVQLNAPKPTRLEGVPWWYNIGVMLIRNTEASLRMWHAVRDWHHRYHTWIGDELMFNAILLEHGGLDTGVDVRPLPPTYACWNFAQAAKDQLPEHVALWHYLGHPKKQRREWIDQHRPMKKEARHG